MKKFFLILITCNLCFSCSVKLKYLSAFDGLNGNPKKVEMRIYTLKHSDSISTEKLAIKHIDYYDSKGRKLKTLRYKPDSLKPFASQKYHYDNYGNLIKIVDYNAYDSVVRQVINHYNKFGVETKSDIIGGPNASVNNLVAITDSNNRIITILDSITKLKGIKRFDRKWREIEFAVYDSLGHKTSNISYEYDSHNNRIKTVYYDITKKRRRISETIFNNNNHPIFTRSTRIKENDTLLAKTSKFEYLYDHKNNKTIEKVYGDSDKLSYIITYSFDYY